MGWYWFPWISFWAGNVQLFTIGQEIGSIPNKQAVTRTNDVKIRWRISESLGIIILIRAIYDILSLRNLLQFISMLYWSMVINKIIYVFRAFASQNVILYSIFL